MSQTETNIVAPAAQGKPRAAKKAQVATPQRQVPARAPQAVREIVTFETAARLCPTAAMAERFARVFGLEPVDYDAIRERVEEQIGLTAKALEGVLNEKALEMHLQRVVGAYIGSAHGAGNFYDAKADLARNLSSALFNEDRDEDRPGVDGQANRAERARIFAATVGLQAYALLAAAEGAKDAYAAVCGQEWKPYVANQAAAQGVERQAAAVQAAAFERA